VRFVTALRVSSAKWAALLLLPATWFLVVERARSAEPGFGTAVAETAAFPVFTVAAVCSACAAWEGGRLRRARIWDLAPAQRWIRIAADALMPVLALAVAAQTVGLLAAAVELGTLPDGTGVPTLLSGAAVVLSYAVIGFGVGSVTPRIVGAPVMLLGVYLWMTLPASSTIMWLRHLTGMQITSSTVTDSVDTTAFTAPVLLCGSLAAGLVLVLSGPGHRILRGSTAVCCVLAGSLTSHQLVVDWGPDAPTVPRAEAPVCAGWQPEICVPREYASEIPRIHRTAADVLTRLEAVGLGRPVTLALVSRNSYVGVSAWRFDPHPGQDEADLRRAVAWSEIGSFPDCRPYDEGYTGNDKTIRAWLLLVAGIDEERAATSVDAARVEEAARVRRFSPETQVEWFHATVTALRACDPTQAVENFAP
jgi:hypothetical protein